MSAVAGSPTGRLAYRVSRLLLPGIGIGIGAQTGACNRLATLGNTQSDVHGRVYVALAIRRSWFWSAGLSEASKLSEDKDRPFHATAHKQPPLIRSLYGAS